MFCSADAVRQDARVGLAGVAVDGDRLAGVVAQQQPVGELEHFDAQPRDLRRDRRDVGAVVVAGALVVDRVPALLGGGLAARPPARSRRPPAASAPRAGQAGRRRDIASPLGSKGRGHGSPHGAARRYKRARPRRGTGSARRRAARGEAGDSPASGPSAARRAERRGAVRTRQARQLAAAPGVPPTAADSAEQQPLARIAATRGAAAGSASAGSDAQHARVEQARAQRPTTVTAAPARASLPAAHERGSARAQLERPPANATPHRAGALTCRPPRAATARSS